MKIEVHEAMREIHEIRAKMYEETKGKSRQEIIAYIKARAAQHEKTSDIKQPQSC